MEPGTTTPTTWAERHTETRSRRSSNDDDRLQPVLFLLKDPLRFIERATHIRLFGIGELAAGGDTSGKLSHSNQRASDFAAAGVRVGVAGNEELLIQGKGGGIAEDVQRLQNLRRQEAPQHLDAADPWKSRDHVRSVAGIVARGLAGSRDVRTM